ncbi:MAG: sigma-54 dependent transcriptional regulator [Victivallales bacterium]|jgi:two-component system NtrC family response regulator
MYKILIVDDELTIIEVLKKLLVKSGYTVTACLNGSDALDKLKEEVFDLMITDVRLPGIDGITLLQRATDLQSHMAVIVMTAYSEVEPAIAAMKNGAFDYVIKPFNFDELLITVQRALNYEMALAENEVLKSTLTANYHFNILIGDSGPMLGVYRLIEKVAKTNSTVLILGESGTGKELVAKALHSSSPRHDAPFITVNCAAMPENLLESELFGYVKGAFTGANLNKKGLFESAHGGSIFLDEISAMPLSMQVKMLRVLQEKEIRRVGGTETIPVDVRVIAASNENLEEKIERGEFRDDLYYRLSVIPIEIPLLKDRVEDIPLLVSHFLEQYEKENKQPVAISQDALRALFLYKWPGNVRELENVLKRAATLCENNTILLSDLPPAILSSASSLCEKKEPANSDKGTRSRIFRKSMSKTKKGYKDEKKQDC